MNTINCLIIDDEPVARKVIREFVEEVDFLVVKGMCENPLEANNLLKSEHIDLLFLDIEMPKMSGLTFLKNLQNPPVAIMTTAYPEHALQGFELDVLDYLVKPISMERFLKATNKARDFFNHQHVRTTQEQDFFFVKCDQKIEKIMLKDLDYIEGLDNYVLIYTKEKKRIVYLTLKAIEAYLPASSFIRVHKSYLVPLQSIVAVEGNQVVLYSNQKLPISKHYKDQVMEKIDAFLLKRR